MDIAASRHVGNHASAARFVMGAGTWTRSPSILLIFLTATFAGALVAGLSRFAFALVAASISLYILTPLQTTTLIIAFRLIVQAIWSEAPARLVGRRVWSFIADAAIGVPVGVAILGWQIPLMSGPASACSLSSTVSMRRLRPSLPPVTHGGATADAAVGFANGVLGGFTGLAGILVVIWVDCAAGPRTSSARVSAGRGRDLRHECVLARFQGRGFSGYSPAVPVRIAGAACRHLARHQALTAVLDEATFRKVVLVLLLASGVALMF